MEILTAEQIAALATETIRDWHINNENRSADYVIATE
jgi:hypothetical protein